MPDFGSLKGRLVEAGSRVGDDVGVIDLIAEALVVGVARVTGPIPWPWLHRWGFFLTKGRRSPPHTLQPLRRGGLPQQRVGGSASACP
jgi:hypothetical protein